MQEFLGINGNTHYLINIDYDEAVSFDSFGNAQGSVTGKLAALSSKIRNDTDIVSFIGDSLHPMCDVYYQGYAGVANKSAFELSRELNKSLQRINHIMYRVKHDELAPGVVQILLPLIKNSITYDSLFKLCNIKDIRRI